METNVDELNDCIERCNTDYTCLNDCFFQLGEKNKLCPCGEKCSRKFDLKLFYDLSEFKKRPNLE